MSGKPSDVGRPRKPTGHQDDVRFDGEPQAGACQPSAAGVSSVGGLASQSTMFYMFYNAQTR